MAYAGYYGKQYIRSSYEYAYALYLDVINVNWDYEVETYDLGFKKYKPDFFIYDRAGNLIKVVEVKSNKKGELELGHRSLKELKSLYGVDGELVTYSELSQLYKKSMSISLTRTIKEWIDHCKANYTKSSEMNGDKNPHYGLKHTEDTKVSISESSKARWGNEETKQRMLEGLRKGRETRWSGEGVKTTAPRTTYTCEVCGNDFTDKVSSNRKACSKTCAGNKAITFASKGRQKEREERYTAIKSKVEQWAIQNKSVVLNAKYNEILPTLEPLISDIDREFSTKDIRIIGLAVLGKDKGRKELLRYMKEIAESS